jgi:hypothetical protein
MSYYEQKYLKYKKKYFNLRNSMKGGYDYKLSEDNIKDLIAYNELLNKYLEIGRTKGLATFNKMKQDAVDNLYSKGLTQDIILNSKLYADPNFYKINDKIKAENIKQYKDASAEEKRLELIRKNNQLDDLHEVSPRDIKEDDKLREQYTEVAKKTNYLKRWLLYHNVMPVI